MSLYQYRATLLRIIDGDTIHLDIDLGLDTHHRVTIRLAGINTPEVHTLEGQAARDHLCGLIAPTGPLMPPPLLVHTTKDRREKYGRYLGTLWLAGEDTTTPSINQRMVDAGHAVPYLTDRT